MVLKDISLEERYRIAISTFSAISDFYIDISPSPSVFFRSFRKTRLFYITKIVGDSGTSLRKAILESSQVMTVPPRGYTPRKRGLEPACLGWLLVR